MTQPFLIIAHRGAPNHAPENTLAAFDVALVLGFTHIELDAQFTRDGLFGADSPDAKALVKERKRIETMLKQSKERPQPPDSD